MLRSFIRTRKRPSKRFFCAACCLLVVFFVAACAQSQEQHAQKIRVVSVTQIASPSSLLVPGTLTIGSYTSYPPQEFIDTTTNMVVGFDIDLITVLAQRMNLHPKIVQLDFTSLLPSLREKDIDIAISAIPITPDLQKQATLLPYFKGGESLLVAIGNPHHIQSTSDLCGLSVGVRSGTLEENDLRVASNSCMLAGSKPIATIALPDQDSVIHLLKTGNVVATYQDAPVSDYYIRQAPSLFAIAGQVTNENVEGIAMRKDDKSMEQALQAAFAAVRKDGTYHYLIMKWGLTTGELTNGTTS